MRPTQCVFHGLHLRCHLIIPQGDGITYKTGSADDVRGQFATNGILDNGQDTNFRAITNNYPVFAFAYDLGSIKATSGSKVFTVGFVRDPAIKYTDLSGTSSERSLYYNTAYTDVGTLVNPAFHASFSGSLISLQRLTSSWATMLARCLARSISTTISLPRRKRWSQGIRSPTSPA